MYVLELEHWIECNFSRAEMLDFRATNFSNNKNSFERIIKGINALEMITSQRIKQCTMTDSFDFVKEKISKLYSHSYFKTLLLLRVDSCLLQHSKQGGVFLKCFFHISQQLY